MIYYASNSRPYISLPITQSTVFPHSELEVGRFILLQGKGIRGRISVNWQSQVRAFYNGSQEDLEKIMKGNLEVVSQEETLEEILNKSNLPECVISFNKSVIAVQFNDFRLTYRQETWSIEHNDSDWNSWLIENDLKAHEVLMTVNSVITLKLELMYNSYFYAPGKGLYLP